MIKSTNVQHEPSTRQQSNQERRPAYLTPGQVADYYQIKLALVYKLIKLGRIEAIKLGQKHLRIPRASLER